MLLLLPPSETKRDGGDAAALDLAALSFPELAPQRKAALAGLRALSRSVGGSMAALGLGPTQRFEIDRNRALGHGPTMPALDRYTGVLFDELDAPSLHPTAREFATRHLIIHSALFGLLGADDPIPAYRLSHDSRVPGSSLRKLWRAPISAVLSAQSELVLDLRSESYVSLGPAPESATYVRVVSEAVDGRRSALSHFNKKGKGAFTRAVVEAGIDHPTVEALVAWASGAGIRLEPGAPGELDLVLPAHTT
ncbi:MAG: peroxide stress protein YaaA [Salinibacterium sp.]|nr:peroxide stress protein YaaA [Salinibacterium sp.]